MKEFTYDDTYLLIKSTLLSNFRVIEKKITPSAKFKDDLGLDSLDMIDFIDYLEVMYGNELVIDADEDNKKEFYTHIQGTVHDMTLFLQRVINEHQRKLCHEHK